MILTKTAPRCALLQERLNSEQPSANDDGAGDGASAVVQGANVPQVGGMRNSEIVFSKRRSGTQASHRPR